MTENRAGRTKAAGHGRSAFMADYAGAQIRPSPNFDDRRAGSRVSMLIMHYTGMKTAEEAERRLTDPQSQVSAHYLVREDGAIVQFVPESKRAWHAGVAYWRGERDINSCSIGIEIAYPGAPASKPYPAVQIAGLIALAHNILARHKGIKPAYILAHSDVAPERKNDPGENFPWRKIAQAGIGLYVPPSPVTMNGGTILGLGAKGRAVAEFQSRLAEYGYNICVNGVFDKQTEWVTQAFQRRFRRQKVDGLADISTLKTLERLLVRLK
ncbi:MAG: N-acetylmuramoyl-L-alanine amidase [Candidatus Tokpelaia sp.]|nr:MAG: N-acetylmuramoyl-L-alanine amidase [Candidatus Tokpelaia sp.]KAA6206558.1 MAG: N-acetylmuramoyl-L-alanine amidase [Candidatus Tokpelaia sp.]